MRRVCHGIPEDGSCHLVLLMLLGLVLGCCSLGCSRAAGSLEREKDVASAHSTQPAASTSNVDEAAGEWGQRQPAVVVAPAPSASSSSMSIRAVAPPLTVVNLNTKEQRAIALYDEFGRIDESALCSLEHLFADYRRRGAPREARVDPRLFQIVYRAAYHFGQSVVELVSGYREPTRRREGLHGKGQAADFKLPGVAAKELAAYLRTIPKLGVGVYSHPKTQYVHVDVRENSFHWIDGSPPRRYWRVRSLGTRGLDALDEAYVPERDDWPEALPYPGTRHTARVVP
ncbi:MAG: DUF882 domain-containing protein [Polyangiaceae bacterium]